MFENIMLNLQTHLEKAGGNDCRGSNTEEWRPLH